MPDVSVAAVSLNERCSPDLCTIAAPPHVAAQHLLVFRSYPRTREVEWEVVLDRPVLAEWFALDVWPGPVPMTLETTVAWLAAEPRGVQPLAMRRIR